MSTIIPSGFGPQQQFLKTLWCAAGGTADDLRHVTWSGEGDLPSVFETSSFAAASVAAAGLALASLTQAQGRSLPGLQRVHVDRRLTAFWFGTSVRPAGWTLPPAWDALAGDYACADGWIRLHTNAPHHRAAALSALKVEGSREAVTRAVATWRGDDLEAAVVAQGGCAAVMRSWAQWQQHPQGQAVLAEPLLDSRAGLPIDSREWGFTPSRPLQGLCVLDMTRVLAGPVATRMLAGLGADVLRIDPPGWDEPSLAPEITLGKRCARLNLRSPADRAQWEQLLAGADVLVHGYRSDALDALGLNAAQRQQRRPGLVDVSVDAYGFTGPWSTRRGFDSLVQMSMGIAEAGQRATGAGHPVPLPVQALDHATGYLLAMAALRGLAQRLHNGHGSIWRTSLARVGAELMRVPRNPAITPLPFDVESPRDWSNATENTAWGPARRLRWPLEVDGVETIWPHPACPLGSAQAVWR
ncbi:MAG: Formyl-coenzyme transferase [Pseudomonadota bacterium]|jgi:crotonobetainyl-CoA:carnitine CoA-transferase CaiB-like acyl-CoA transferase